MTKLHDDWKDMGLVILAINVMEKQQTVNAYIKKNKDRLSLQTMLGFQV